MKTISAKPDSVKRDWYVVDATRARRWVACRPNWRVA
jgi:hypothetical protein